MVVYRFPQMQLTYHKVWKKKHKREIWWRFEI